jgi:hypothetical protein
MQTSRFGFKPKPPPFIFSLSSLYRISYSSLSFTTTVCIIYECVLSSYLETCSNTYCLHTGLFSSYFNNNNLLVNKTNIAKPDLVFRRNIIKSKISICYCYEDYLISLPAYIYYASYLLTGKRGFDTRVLNERPLLHKLYQLS